MEKFHRDRSCHCQVNGAATKTAMNQKPTDTRHKLEVAIFSHEPPNCAVALLRLAGIVRHLERQDRMGLHWCTARDPQVTPDELINTDLFVIHREFCDHRISPQILAAA